MKKPEGELKDKFSLSGLFLFYHFIHPQSFLSILKSSSISEAIPSIRKHTPT